MAKRPLTSFVCQDCGAVTAKWAGRCESCGAWNTISEEAIGDAETVVAGGKGGRALSLSALDHPVGDSPNRLVSNVAEFDRVCGGGLVPGSAVLVGGDPGIGKSTLLLQITAQVAAAGHSSFYITGEESVDQVRLRAQRLGLVSPGVKLAAATSVRDVLATFDRETPPAILVIDSIQTMFVDTLASAPGSVGQVRASAQELIRAAKRKGICLLLIGHVTKDGQIAGPRVLEHMVDAVLYFEGDAGHQFRILRAVKNRFGATDEIGVFTMSSDGLSEVQNPSSLFLADREHPVPGAAVFAGMEGTRPILVEIEALVSPTAFGTPRRAVVGWDGARLAMVLAVLDARCGLSLGGRDVYLNVAGGLRISEPAADLAVAAALISSWTDNPVPSETVIFGEMALSGEVRAVSYGSARLKESAKLGFSRALMPVSRETDASSLAVTEIQHISTLVNMFTTDGPAVAAAS